MGDKKHFYLHHALVELFVTDHRSIVVSPIIDHLRSPITDQLLCQLITDHRSPPITDQSSDSTHHAVGSVVRSSITDHRSQTAQPVPNSCIDHRSSITDET